MLSVKINNKAHQIPTGWHEVTWAQYLQLLEPIKITEKLSIFTGIDSKVLSNAKISGLEPLLIALKFIDESGMDIPENPTKLGDYILPKDLTLESVDQYWMLEAQINKSAEESTIQGRMKYISVYASIYCQALNEDFDINKAIELSKTFDDLPCIDVLAAGSFFLYRLTSIEKNLPMNFLLTITRWKNLRPALKSSQKRSGITRHLIKSHATSKKTMKR